MIFAANLFWQDRQIDQTAQSIFLPFEIDVSMSRLFAPRKHKNAAFRLPPIAEGEAEFRRRRISPVNFGQRLLIVFPELFAVRNEAPIELEGPTFAKGAQRNARVVLHDEAAVLEQQTADSGEPVAVHKIRSGMDQTDSGSARRAPSKESAVPSREIGLEVI